MGFKNLDQQTSFADLILKDSMEKNRCLEQLMNIQDSIDWARLESVLMSHYKVRRSDEGPDAYSPLVLFKCLLLQKWFCIPSDPELESQINDRISFKEFLQLPFHMPSPDHSTFSRFRARLSKKGMIKINSELLNQFAKEGITINEGIAVHARLVKSASRPVNKGSFPIVDHRRVDTKSTGQLGHGLFFLEGYQSHLGLQLGAALVSPSAYVL